MFFRESEANAGHFSPRGHRKLRLSWREKGKFEALKGFGGLKTYLHGLRNHCFKQQKENQCVITKTENNEHNQKLTEIVVGE